MIARFFLYSLLKNLRFGDPFLVLYLRHLGYSFAEIGAVLGAQHMVTAALEFPLGVLADRFGRRSSLALGFLSYAVAFGVLSTLDDSGRAGMYLGVSAFALAEALRSGSHKAIMLDYLEGRGELSQSTQLVARTRTMSKASAAGSAFCGGLLCMWTGGFAALFVVSAAAALCGFALMLTYPAALEGEQRRARAAGSQGPGLWAQLSTLGSGRALWRLLLQSALFEGQLKLGAKHYLQPFLQQGLSGMGLPVPGLGAVYIGATEAAGDGLGAVGARSGGRFERWAGGSERALQLAYLGVLGLSVGAAVGARLDLMWLLVGSLLLLNLLQNARRPVFVSALAGRVDSGQRAAALSLESLLRNLWLLLLLPTTGAVADRFGLAWAFVLTAVVLLPGVWLAGRATTAPPG